MKTSKALPAKNSSFIFFWWHYYD